MGTEKSTTPAEPRLRAADKALISAGNSSKIRVRRGRPSEIRLTNRFRIFSMTATPVLRRLFPAWCRATMQHLASWDAAAAVMAWEGCANIIGEVLAAGVRNDAADSVHPVLPFDFDDAERILDPETLTGEAAMAVCFDLLRANVIPLWIARAEEALDPRHSAHALVWMKHAQIVAAMKRSYMTLRGAAADAAAPEFEPHEAAAAAAADAARGRAGAVH